MAAANEFRSRVRAARDCGVVHVELRNRDELAAGADPRAAADALVRAIGFRALGPKWRELTREAAGEALRAVLHVDQAYSRETMSAATATALAQEFLAWFAGAAWFYTNGAFPPREARSGSGWMGSWDPVTAATFDTGVVAVSEHTAGLVWVEDED